MLKRILTILGIFILGIFGGIFGSQILWPLLVERPLFLKYKLEPNPIYVTERKEIKIQENTALKEAIKEVERSVVFVRTKTKTGKTLEGSGLILTSDGLLITLEELAPRGSNSSFFVENELVSSQILKRGEKENLILVKAEKKNLKTVGFTNLEKIKIGERIFLLGEVFEEGKIKTVVNEGIIKSFDEEKIETNIFENKNLAGSPLFDIEGNLVGICQIEKDGKVIAIPNSKIKSFSGL